jgi:hypothetical protein
LTERTTWTDARIDDLADRLTSTLDNFDRTVDRLDKTVDRLWEDFRDFRTETRTELRDVRGEIVAARAEMSRIGWAIAAALFGQLAAGVIAAVIALT